MAELTAAGKLLEAERADFGVLFREMDAFVVHGGLGTTVEALRMRKPTVVTAHAHPHPTDGPTDGPTVHSTMEVMHHGTYHRLRHGVRHGVHRTR